ncbi:hypothetical protein OD91_0084 [Lutibacter sp. Hel_I_33_5]|uniref:hypothetical protein n=1 Tax=Lutibacter sp. Hel_I_33_5 TaxID=1566289 RepID=UPI00119D120A|nr:hypothetical protein [Lutibacter sp. Hel_I_33_5]TVZ54847.1 hypothetical protein OD91_0084 [Lutibacter sp. Hel_I_33_5]
MKKTVILLFWILSVFNNYSQKNKIFNFELLGSLIINTDQLISYKIEFNVNNKGFLEGYSYTDISGDDETKSYIRGYYNKKSRKIKFKENDILYTKSKSLPEEFCFIDFEGKFKGNSRKKTLSGKFTGIYNDKDTCATGKIKLVSIKFVEKKIKKIYKKIKKIKKIDSIVKKQIEPKNYLRKFSETSINSGEKVSVFIYTKKLRLEVWDYGKEDGDIISISNNGKMIIENFRVTKEKKKLNIDLKNSINIIKIINISAGKLKTNTTKIKLYDYRRDYEVLANLEEGKSAIINIIKAN